METRRAIAPATTRARDRRRDRAARALYVQTGHAMAVCEHIAYIETRAVAVIETRVCIHATRRKAKLALVIDSTDTNRSD